MALASGELADGDRASHYDAKDRPALKRPGYEMQAPTGGYHPAP